MKILLHQCCGPCSIFPIEILKNEKFEITGFFYNPNIHPMTEFYKRLETTMILNKNSGINTIVNEEYGLINFTRNVVFREKHRCKYCYSLRIEETAKTAKEKGFDAFTSSLLYSKYQDHDLMIELFKEASEKFEIEFLYRDFRTGWKEGILKSKEMGLYRQQYCGCIYSEEDRYHKQLPRLFKNFKEELYADE
jgi:predicted adenine nucleotide alpha hydrolase (AANH) superfamily ATPase